MEAWLQQWLSLLLRWAHFITGIAWIGASFYFNWLENHLQRRALQAQDAHPIGRGPVKADPRQSESMAGDSMASDSVSGDPISGDPIAGDAISGDPIAGDLWAVHGGGFYYLQKYRVAPDHLPEPLHWFKYEAYFTWITGVALLIVMYYWDAHLFMLDPSVSGISATQAIVLGVVAMLVSWLVYDGLCRLTMSRSLLQRNAAWQGVLICAWFVLLAWALSQYLSGRAAFIHVGAAMGTVMVANVFFVIIPAQKELVAALVGGRIPDAGKARDALLRSRHNNYFTLPVLFIMISSHYPATYSGAYNWLFLTSFSLAAVGIRHWFNVRHLPQHSRWVLPVSVLVMLCLVLASMPRQATVSLAAGQGAPTTLQVMPLIAARCTGCHSSLSAISGMSTAPLGIAFDTPGEVEAQAERIFQAAVVNRTMPLGNMTAMSDAEREQLAQWYAGQSKNTP